MNRRRIAALVAGVALAGGGGSVAHAAATDDVSVNQTQERYWACLAVDHVEIGTCVKNPYPDPSTWPHPTDIVEGVVGDLPV